MVLIAKPEIKYYVAKKLDNSIVFVNYFTNDLHEGVEDCFHSCFDDKSDCIGPNKKTLTHLYKLQHKVDDLIEQVEESYNLKLD